MGKNFINVTTIVVTKLFNNVIKMVKSKYHSYSRIALGILFIAWGVLSIIWDEMPGSPFLAVAGLFIIYSGVKHFYRYNYLTNLVVNLLSSNPRTTVKWLAQESRLKEKPF